MQQLLGQMVAQVLRLALQVPPSLLAVVVAMARTGPQESAALPSVVMAVYHLRVVRPWPTLVQAVAVVALT